MIKNTNRNKNILKKSLYLPPYIKHLHNLSIKISVCLFTVLCIAPNIKQHYSSVDTHFPYPSH